MLHLSLVSIDYIKVDSDQSKACFDDLEALWRTDGIGIELVIIGRRQSKSTFGANEYWVHIIGICL